MKLGAASSGSTNHDLRADHKCEADGTANPTLWILNTVEKLPLGSICGCHCALPGNHNAALSKPIRLPRRSL